MLEATGNRALLAQLAEQRELIARLQQQVDILERDAEMLERMNDRLAHQRDRRVARRRDRAQRRLARRTAPTSTVFPRLACGADIQTDPVIYGLVDPRRPEHVRYVGQAQRAIPRLVGHLTERSSTNPRCRWVAALLAEGVAPDMVLIERVSYGADIAEIEAYWIHTMRGLGHADLNSNIPRWCAA